MILCYIIILLGTVFSMEPWNKQQLHRIMAILFMLPLFLANHIASAEISCNPGEYAQNGACIECSSGF